MSAAFECLSDLQKQKDYVLKNNIFVSSDKTETFKKRKKYNKRKWECSAEEVERMFKENVGEKKRRDEEKSKEKKEREKQKEEEMREQFKQQMFADSYMDSFMQHHSAWKKWQKKATAAPSASTSVPPQGGNSDSSSSRTVQNKDSNQKRENKQQDIPEDKQGEEYESESEEFVFEDGNEESNGKKAFCYICLRKFSDQNHLNRHEKFSEIHKINSMELKKKAFF